MRSIQLSVALPMALLVAGGSALLPPEAWANEAGPGAAPALTEIVVVAQKREQNLQDVPISVAVRPGQWLAEANIANLQELSQYVPNLLVQEAPITDAISIRGIQSYLNPGFEQSVGMFSDGVYRGRGVQSRFAFLDLERVEVLRGSQDTLFGNNTIAGAVILKSRQPTEEVEAELSLLHEPEHGETVWTGFLSGPLSDALSARLALVDRRLSDGWIANRFYDEQRPRGDEWAARGTLRWDAGESTELLLRYEHGEFDTNGSPAELFALAPPLGPQAPNGGVEGNVDFASNVGNRSPEIDFGTELLLSGSTDEIKLEISHALDAKRSVAAILAYSEYQFDRLFDADGNSFDVLGLVEEEGFEQTSLELRYEMDSRGPFSLLAGAYLLQSDLTTQSFGGVNVIDPVAEISFGDVDGDGDIEFLGVPDPGAAALVNAAALAGDPAAALLPFMRDFTRYTLLDQRTRSVALFGELTWQMTDRITSTLGLRFTQNDKDGTQAAYCLPFGSRSGADRDPSCGIPPDLGAILATAALLDPVNPDPVILATLASLVNGRELALVGEAIPHVTPVSRDEDFVSGHFGLQWRISPEAMAFAAVRQGFKTGGFNAFALMPANVEFGEESVLSVEVGTKLRFFDGAAEIHATLFDMSYEDLQVSQFTGNTSFIVDNAAKATVRGAELEGRWQASRSIALFGGLAYNDFQFDRYPFAGCTVPQTIQSGLGTAACAAAGINDLSGRPAPRSPKLMSSISVEYRTIFGAYELRSALNWIWRDGQYGAADLDPRTHQGSYSTVNLSGTLGPRDGSWDVSVVAKNLTDENYFAVADDVPLFPLNYNRQNSRPRSIGVRFRWRFF